MDSRRVRRATQRAESYGIPLDVRIVHYMGVEDGYDVLVKALNAEKPQRMSGATTKSAEDGGSARKRSKVDQ